MKAEELRGDKFEVGFEVGGGPKIEGVRKGRGTIEVLDGEMGVVTFL